MRTVIENGAIATVDGIGPTKLGLYGDGILAVVDTTAP